MDKVELSIQERAILANQYEILAKLYPEREKDCGRLVTILTEGYPTHYADIFEAYSEPLAYEECREVMDILDMFRMVKRALDSIPDKSGLDLYKLSFRGFDGNDGSGYLSYARFLIDTDMKWPELKDSGDDLNSHMPVVDTYRAMVEAWLSSANKYDLTINDLNRIQDAAKPE